MIATRLLRWPLCLALLLAVAGCKDKKDPVDPPAVDDQCAVDADCPDPSLFFCDKNAYVCQPGCRAKSDCTSAVRGEYALAYCDTVAASATRVAASGRCARVTATVAIRSAAMVSAPTRLRQRRSRRVRSPPIRL